MVGIKKVHKETYTRFEKKVEIQNFLFQASIMESY